jgi:methionine-R-sulfoxide reductase
MNPTFQKSLLVTGLLALFGGGLFFWQSEQRADQKERESLSHLVPEPEDEWRSRLSPEAYSILREGGTERPFSSPLNDEKRPGTYVAADTGEPVYRSEDKFDSGTGWPSFTRPIKPAAVIERADNSLFSERTEILSTAGGHLGHVFMDGPAPTGLRYCRRKRLQSSPEQLSS